MVLNKKTVGLFMLSIACIIWIITPFIGFLNLTGKQLAIYLPLIIILGEVFFLIAIAILGKGYTLKLKVFIKSKWHDIKIYFKKKSKK